MMISHRRRRGWAMFTASLIGILAVAWAGAGARAEVHFDQRHTAKKLKKRPGVTREADYLILRNDRSLYELSYAALTGKPVSMGPDKQIQGIRSKWQAYRPAPTVSERGFAPLGLYPHGNWGDMGFFNLYVNGIGYENTLPKITTGHSDHQARVTLTWTNSQAKLIQRLVLREHDNRLLMSLRLEPKVKRIKSLVLRLGNVPVEGNTAYGNPASRADVVITGGERYRPPKGVGLSSRQPWAVFGNTDLGVSPSAAMYLPAEVERASVILGKKRAELHLRLNPAGRAFHVALWSMPKLPTEQLVQRLEKAGPRLQRELRMLGGADWSKPLSPVPRDVRRQVAEAGLSPSWAQRRQGYMLGRHEPFDYADANTEPTDPLKTLKLWASPGQRQPGSFLIRGLQDLGTVGVKTSALTAAGGASIAASRIDARVVKVWPQRVDLHGAGSEIALTPELLVRDDGVDLDAWRDRGGKAPSAMPRSVRTRIPAGVTKQIWLAVSVPEDASAGTYKGTIRVEPEAGRPASVPVEVRVLPIHLRSPEDRYILGIYYRGQPWKASKAKKHDFQHITDKRYRRQLRDMREHGFNATSIMLEGPDKFKNLTAAYPALKELGFRSPVMIEHWGYVYRSNFSDGYVAKQRETVRSYMRYAASHDAPWPGFYGIDEPHGKKEIDRTIKRAKINHEVEVDGRRAPFMVAGDRGAMYDLVGHVDYPIVSSYYAGRSQMRELNDRYHKAGAKTLYYWQIWSEYPKGSRLNTGYFLYASGYDGVFPYNYQHVVGSTAYDDYPGTKDMCAAYPSPVGPLPTLQWEGAASGVNDLRYLHTLDALVDRLAGRDAAKARSVRRKIASLMDKYGYKQSAHWGRVIYGATNWPNHQGAVPNARFDQDRRTIARMIMKLQNEVNTP